MKVDLHIHSTYSDSSRSPEEIVALAKKRRGGFCKKNDMRITGGCDCHGEFDKSEGFTIGALDISLSMLDLRGIFALLL